MNNNICKNCNNKVHANYCEVCGQATSTQRLNWHYIIHELQHSLFHVDKGILFTIKELFINPEKVIKNYWSGKRISYFKPFAFMIILATLYGFITHFFKVFPEDKMMNIIYSDLPTDEVLSLTTFVNNWIYGHYAIAMLAIMPSMALSSAVVFRKQGYNYTEHLIASSYISGQQLVILLIIFPIYYFTLRVEILSLQYILIMAYTIFVYCKLFYTKNLLTTIIRSILCYILNFAFVFLIVIIIATFYILLTELL